MVKLLKPGRVVLVTAGRFAGKKGIVVSSNDSGTKDKTFGHALVAGIVRGPLKVHKRMSKKKIERRTGVRAFIKSLNFNHLMPTRYSVSTDFDLKALVNAPVEGETEASESTSKKESRKALQKILREKFLNPVNDKTSKVSKDVLFLRKKLRF